MVQVRAAATRFSQGGENFALPLGQLVAAGSNTRRWQRFLQPSAIVWCHRHHAKFAGPSPQRFRRLRESVNGVRLQNHMAPVMFPQDVMSRAAGRWRERTQERAGREDAIRTGRIVDVETPERIQKRLSRLSNVSSRVPTAPETGAASRLVETVGLERVVGQSDFLGMQFVELALAVS